LPSNFFAPGGRLASAHPGYEHRPGQEEMAGAVAATLERGGSLMVEAGTGTGKTLAYLVPALESGRRLIVSTGTRNLQDQIFNKDLPFLRERAGLTVSAAMMKGRDNYLCRYRMTEFLREPLFENLTDRRFLGLIADWSRGTDSGDRSEIAELPDNLRLWRDINAKADTCTGTRCEEYEACWLTVIKRRAQQAQIVVVNHHLFFADLAVRTSYGSVLPDYDTVVFDEAHLLEETATLYFGVQVSAGQLEDLARAAEKLARRSGGPGSGGGGAARLREAAREFYLPFVDVLRRAPGRITFEPPERGGPEVEVPWAVLCESIDDLLRQSLRNARRQEEADSIAQRAEAIRTGLAQVLARDDPAFVYGLEVRGRSNIVLSAAPIDVSQLLRQRLFDELHACVLTSATLAVERSFDFFQQRLGLDDADARVVESPFDHRKQALLYLPRGMPEPRHPKFAERATREIADLLEITAGRAFLLFTSYAMMQRVRDELTGLDRWPLIVQGEGSKVALVETFKRGNGAVLLGTTSFWHGVDVPGEALSLVVIDKLPYDVPSDPLIAARIERIKDEGGNPFREYQTPLAVLELKQGLGRLLRSREDRGLLCVLDPRLTGRSYGKTFLRSLPPYPVVREIEDCRAFFTGP
jgi:ATP-dependent DNA helicase DinG